METTFEIITVHTIILTLSHQKNDLSDYLNNLSYQHHASTTIPLTINIWLKVSLFKVNILHLFILCLRTFVTEHKDEQQE